LAGSISSRGKYNAVNKLDETGKKVVAIERNGAGAIEKNEVIRLQTVQLPSYHDASSNTKLNVDFVKFAISDEGRPKTISAGMWNKMKPSVRLNLHIKKYADDVFPGCEYSYEIIGGDEEDED
jgi:hypothetical protein